MQKIDDIINKLEKPLLFSSKENFRFLKAVSHLEPALGALVNGLGEALGEKGAPALEAAEILADLRKTVSSLDGLGLEEKKVRIQKALSLLSSLRGALRGANISADGSAAARARLERLKVPAQFVKGIGPRIAGILARQGIHTVEDLLYFLPRTYEDRRKISPIARTEGGRRETVMGEVVRSGLQRYGIRRCFEAVVRDASGYLKAVWFQGNPLYLAKSLKEGSRVILTGEVRYHLGRPGMVHPDFETVDEREEDASLHFQRIVPIYTEAGGLHQKNLRRIMHRAVEDYAPLIPDALPPSLTKKRGLAPLVESVRSCHFPGPEEDPMTLMARKSKWHRRLCYEEFFYFSLGLALKRSRNRLEEGIVFPTDGPLRRAFLDILPFTLTAAQRRVIGEIDRDMASPFPMNRLLQGDVGSGKTVVAMAAAVAACDGGYQAAFMAPTEILAQQHYRNLLAWSEALSIPIALLTGSVKGRQRKAVLTGIEGGEILITVGTHALIQEDVRFRRLGLAVIDEQHRFGVLQRASLRAKGYSPDILVMTATPIPRTMALTVYGDLDLSVIDEMPPGKKPVKTMVFFEAQRGKVYDIIASELAKGHQAFIVYPLVEESEILDLKDATRMAEHLARDVFPRARVGLVHGRMKSRQKEEAMAAFREGNLDILVATTVIEVGIDIPRASLMVIEHAERFGLSQLHQLRGRVGRGEISSTCVLLAHGKATPEARRRLRVMAETNDGFRIAEEDLAIRGPGEFMGTKQWGMPDFRVADLIRDAAVFHAAREDAFALAREDPGLDKAQHRALREILLHRWSGRLALAKVG
ncbi:MAG TPA: ATP-dependent DNA helicase RecG [Syntrophales bacterium]|nr:ATP-dependent DNA helicase RecG [Syntrophales bacterium]